MRIVIPYDGYEHLGIGYLASVASQHGHTVHLLPVDAGDYIRGGRRLSERRLRHAVSHVKDLRPDVVAFSLNSFRAGDYSRLATRVRESGIKTIAGGPHASAEPVLTMQSGSFDALVAGESESVFVDALEYTVNGSGPPPSWLWTREHRATAPAPLPDLNRLPFPAKEIFYRPTPYEAKDYKIITSRGCAFRCIFCSHGSPASSPGVRRRSVDDVIRELQWARHRFHPATIYFLDDNFTVNRGWLKDFLSDYRRTIGIPFHAILHPSSFDESVAWMLRDAHCFKIRVGVQTLTPRLRRFLGRTEETEQVGRAISSARKSGLSVEVDHMVNLPGETLEEAREGISWYNDHRPDAVKVYWLTPLPGTVWFQKALDGGYISERTAGALRRGTGFGPHSYLFYGRTEYSDPRWLGIHALLVYLPYLPRRAVAFLVRIRADRMLRIPSFLFLVGFSRLPAIIRGSDRVGEAHLLRLWQRYTQTNTGHTLKEER